MRMARFIRPIAAIVFDVSLFIMYDWITMIMGHSKHELGTKKHVVLPKKIVIGHPSYSHLSKTATFLCPQGGRCGEVGL